jgi:hypothetical protein
MPSSKTAILRTRLQRMACVRLVAVFFVLSILGGMFVSRVLAAVRDDFESGPVSWYPGQADVQYHLESQQRITADPHSGRTSELIQISAGVGTYVYFTHEVGSARIVAELSPSVWIKANRPGIQLLARVVLPHTTDPRTGQPTTTLIAGSSYTNAGVWQQLQIADTPQLLNRQVRVLRAQMGPQVDAREAYIDKLFLNVYGGQGQTIVNIDDLVVDGVVPSANGTSTFATASTNTGNANPTATNGATPTGNGAEITPNSATPNHSPAHQITFNGSLLVVDGKPFFPRIVQSQGEPLAWLKQVGFNVVRMANPITDDQSAEAQRLGLWLISPPPVANQQATGAADPAIGPISPVFAPVLAWHLGNALAARELPYTAALARQLRTADRQFHRPLVCNPEEESLAYSRQVDVLSESCFPLASSLELQDFGEWFAQRPRLTRAGTPLWSVIQTEPAANVIEQAAGIAGREAPIPTIDTESMRLLTFQAFCSGSRGIEFASNSRLDAADNSTRLRATSLALLNLELGLVEPWGAAGNYLTTVTTSDPDVNGFVLTADKARLMIAMRLPRGSQYVAAPEAIGTALPGMPGTLAPQNRKGDTPDPNTATKDTSKLMQRTYAGGSTLSDTVRDQTRLPSGANNPLFREGAMSAKAANSTLIVPGVPDTYNVFEITPAGLRPIRHQKVAGGTAIVIEDFLLTSLVLMTNDVGVENSLSLRAKQTAPLAARLQRDLTGLLRDQAASVDNRLTDHTQYPAATTALATADAGLQKATQLLATADAAQAANQLQAADFYSQAYLAARNAAFPIEHWKHDVWQRCAHVLQSPVSSPLAVNFVTLPEQVQFAAAITGPPPGESLLVGGDCEDLQTMLQAGWRHAEHSRPDLQTSVELSPMAPFAGQHCLHLQVQPIKQQTVTQLAGQLVESPPLWVTSAPVHLQAGDVVCIRGQVRVSERIVGSVDGLMIIDSLGGQPLAERFRQTDGWREFVMYRAASYAQDLTVTFALTGIGQAWIDDLSIRAVRRGQTSGPANLTSAPWPNAANIQPR